MAADIPALTLKFARDLGLYMALDGEDTYELRKSRHGAALLKQAGIFDIMKWLVGYAINTGRTELSAAYAAKVMYGRD